jgi:hypothetical protein
LSVAGSLSPVATSASATQQIAAARKVAPRFIRADDLDNWDGSQSVAAAIR